jgi:hypothetical protein
MSNPPSEEQAKNAMLPVNRSAIGCFLVLGAAVSFLMALAFGLHTWQFRRTALRASGEVIELRKETGESDITYRAVFRFKDAAGKEHTVTSSVNSKPATHRVGDRVTVLYHPNRPGAARIDSYWELWFDPTIPGLIAAGFTLWFILAIRRKEL